MKLIIDIPEKQYEYLAKIADAGEEPLGYFERVIMRGTPLDTIKAKIANMSTHNVKTRVLQILENIGNERE